MTEVLKEACSIKNLQDIELLAQQLTKDILVQATDEFARSLNWNDYLLYMKTKEKALQSKETRKATSSSPSNKGSVTFTVDDKYALGRSSSVKSDRPRSINGNAPSAMSFVSDDGHKLTQAKSVTSELSIRRISIGSPNKTKNSPTFLPSLTKSGNDGSKSTTVISNLNMNHILRPDSKAAPSNTEGKGSGSSVHVSALKSMGSSSRSSDLHSEAYDDFTALSCK